MVCCWANRANDEINLWWNVRDLIEMPVGSELPNLAESWGVLNTRCPFTKLLRIAEPTDLVRILVIEKADPSHSANWSKFRNSPLRGDPCERRDQAMRQYLRKARSLRRYRARFATPRPYRAASSRSPRAAAAPTRNADLIFPRC